MMRPFLVSVTYDTWDEQEAGDTDDRGYEIEDDPCTLTEALRAIENIGTLDELQISDDLIRGYSADEDINYRTGEVTMRAIHVRGSKRALRRLAQVLQSR